MKNQKLKNALRKMQSKKAEQTEKLDSDEILLLRGGTIAGKGEAISEGCTGFECTGYGSIEIEY